MTVKFPTLGTSCSCCYGQPIKAAKRTDNRTLNQQKLWHNIRASSALWWPSKWLNPRQCPRVLVNITTRSQVVKDAWRYHGNVTCRWQPPRLSATPCDSIYACFLHSSAVNQWYIICVIATPLLLRHNVICETERDCLLSTYETECYLSAILLFSSLRMQFVCFGL